MTEPHRPWSSAARSRWHGARTRLVPHWTPPDRPRGRPQPPPRAAPDLDAVLEDLLAGPPHSNGRHESAED
jgi:hypothetical protein